MASVTRDEVKVCCGFTTRTNAAGGASPPRRLCSQSMMLFTVAQRTGAGVVLFFELGGETVHHDAVAGGEGGVHGVNDVGQRGRMRTLIEPGRDGRPQQAFSGAVRGRPALEAQTI